MSFTINPDTIASSLYPVAFRSIEPSGVVQQQVNVFLDGLLEGSFLAAQTGTSGTSAVFDINVQSFLISQLAPKTNAKTSFFGNLYGFSKTNNTDVISSLYCTAFNQTVNASGFIVTATAGQTSTTGFVLPSLFYAAEYDMNDFYQPSANPFKFLTARNEDFVSCNSSGNIYLSYLGRGTNAAQFEFYEKSGASAITIVDTINDVNNDDLYSLSVGVANIFNTSAIFHAGNFPINPDFYDYYDVSVGSYDGAFTRLSEKQRIYIFPNCDDNIELHWFGIHGGAESYQFTGLMVDRQTSNADTINLAQRWIIEASPKANTFDKNIIKVNQRSNKSKLVTVAVSHEDAAYIATMFNSPEVYLIEDGKYVNVTIANGEISTGNNRATDIGVSFEIVYQNTPVAQL
jgi:hypothetical protein